MRKKITVIMMTTRARWEARPGGMNSIHREMPQDLDRFAHFRLQIRARRHRNTRAKGYRCRTHGSLGTATPFESRRSGDGFPACIPQPGKPIDWCVDLNNVEFFKYPNALPGPWWDLEFFHGHSQMSEDLYARIMGGGCTEDELKGKTAPAPLGAGCLALMAEMSEQVGFFYACERAT